MAGYQSKSPTPNQPFQFSPMAHTNHDNRRTNFTPYQPFQFTPMVHTNRDNRRTNFTPYYDILKNDGVYILRCILPLMKEDCAQGLTIKINLRHSKCHISGNYVPSTLIGKESNRQIQLRQPLLPMICSDMTTTGYFELDISIPSDIRDDLSKVKLIHDCWGICMSFPRRKILHDTQVALTSCFGTTPSLSQSKSTTMEQPTLSMMTVPRRITQSTPRGNGASNIGSARPVPPNSEDPHDGQDNGPAQDLTDPNGWMGKEVMADGIVFGAAYAKHSYPGVVVKCTDLLEDPSKGYFEWQIEFEDMTIKFELDDLRKASIVTKEEYVLLEKRSYSPKVLEEKKKAKHKSSQFSTGGNFRQKEETQARRQKINKTELLTCVETQQIIFCD